MKSIYVCNYVSGKENQIFLIKKRIPDETGCPCNKQK